jgi:hypothetical protein
MSYLYRFNSEEFVRKIFSNTYAQPPLHRLARRALMKSLFLPLIYVGTITVWYGGTLAACAELGPDTANIESITGLKGVLNEKENTFKVSKPRNDVSVTVEQSPMAPFMGSRRGPLLPQA